MMYIFTQSHVKNFTPNVPHIPCCAVSVINKLVDMYV